MLIVMIAIGVSLTLAAPALADQRSLITNKACSIIDNSNRNIVTEGNVNDNVPGCSTSDPGVAQKGGLAYEIVNTFMYIAGIVSFVFVIIGGIRYIASDGEPTRVKAAKQTLLYAIIGLIITLIAAAIAGFVIRQVVGG